MMFLVISILVCIVVVFLIVGLLAPESNSNRDEIKRWVNITLPTEGKFCFLYEEEQFWGGKEYLARKIVQLLENEIEVENFDQSTSRIPFKGLKQFQHPYSNIRYLKIIPEPLAAEIGESVKLSVQAIDKDSNARTMSVEQLVWTTTGGKLDQLKGFQLTYNATRAGSFEINASLGNFSTTTKITVKEPARLNSLLISPQHTTLALGETQLLELKGEDQYKQPIAITHVKWLKELTASERIRAISTECIETSTQSLLFAADVPGHFWVTAQSNGVEGKATVTVIEPPKLNTLRISPSEVNLVLGEIQGFAVEGKDQHEQRIDTGIVNWRASIGSINEHGRFLAEVIGQATIIAEVNGIEAKAYVNITEPSRLASLLIEPLWTEMQEGQTQRFTVTGQDQYGNFTNPGLVEWQATTGQIDRNGNFKATTPGTCTITVRSNSISSQVNVTVTSNATSFPGTLVGTGIKDPVSQEPFHVGEIIYCCTNCELGHHEDSWKYLNHQCSRCKSNQHVNVYRLSNTFIAKANQYSTSSKVDLSSLQGQGSDGCSCSLRHALTSFTYSYDDREENLWRFEYAETQSWGNTEVIARRVLSIRETEIQVEDCNGNVIWLPIALLLAVAVVPTVATGAIVGGVIIWAVANYMLGRMSCSASKDGYSPSLTPNESSNRLRYTNAVYTDTRCEKESKWVAVKGQVLSIQVQPSRSISLFLDERDERVDAKFYAYIPSSYVSNFPNVTDLTGKEIQIFGEARIYENQSPHIILRQSSQLKEI
ncbi:hypothetical protein H6F95_28680 [Cyanobacteria bacterium FACHB-471]|nr:hypothetical protein [Cyanobacteria bacterium FACHB-471]